MIVEVRRKTGKGVIVGLDMICEHCHRAIRSNNDVQPIKCHYCNTPAAQAFGKVIKLDDPKHDEKVIEFQQRYAALRREFERRLADAKQK